MLCMLYKEIFFNGFLGILVIIIVKVRSIA